MVVKAVKTVLAGLISLLSRKEIILFPSKYTRFLCLDVLIVRISHFSPIE